MQPFSNIPGSLAPIRPHCMWKWSDHHIWCLLCTELSAGISSSQQLYKPVVLLPAFNRKGTERWFPKITQLKSIRSGSWSPDSRLYVALFILGSVVPTGLVTKASKLQVYTQQGSAVLDDNDRFSPWGGGQSRVLWGDPGRWGGCGLSLTCWCSQGNGGKVWESRRAMGCLSRAQFA